MIEIYPDVTADPETWPVLCRLIDPGDGREVVAHDPGPYLEKLRQRVLTERRKAQAAQPEGEPR